MDAWMSLLPSDVRSSLGDLTSDEDSDAVRFSAGLRGEMDLHEILEYVRDRGSIIARLGRPRRVRFLSWVAGRTYGVHPHVFRLLVDEDEEGSGDVGEAVPLFAEDVRAVAESLGPRAARAIADGATLDIARTVGLELIGRAEPDPHQGGAI